MLENEESVEPANRGFCSDSDDITEQEFEELLDVLHGKGGSPTHKQERECRCRQCDDEISDEEFEKVLDELHGQGKFSVKNVIVATGSRLPMKSPRANSSNCLTNCTVKANSTPGKMLEHPPVSAPPPKPEHKSRKNTGRRSRLPEPVGAWK